MLLGALISLVACLVAASGTSCDFTDASAAEVTADDLFHEMGFASKLPAAIAREDLDFKTLSIILAAEPDNTFATVSVLSKSKALGLLKFHSGCWGQVEFIPSS